MNGVRLPTLRLPPATQCLNSGKPVGIGCSQSQHEQTGRFQNYLQNSYHFQNIYILLYKEFSMYH